MPSKLPHNFKSLVIQEWLSGTQRDRIATEKMILVRGVWDKSS